MQAIRKLPANYIKQDFPIYPKNTLNEAGFYGCLRMGFDCGNSPVTAIHSKDFYPGLGCHGDNTH